MWTTIIYIVLLVVGIVGMAYYIYNGIRNKKKKEEGKERKNVWPIGIYSALMVVPITHLTEKWLSRYITSEIAMFFLQILIIITLMLIISLFAKRIAKRE